jgi:hypothetical protein
MIWSTYTVSAQPWRLSCPPNATFNKSKAHSIAHLLLKSPLLRIFPRLRCTKISSGKTPKDSVSTIKLSLQPTQRICGLGVPVVRMKSFGTGTAVYCFRITLWKSNGISKADDVVIAIYCTSASQPHPRKTLHQTARSHGDGVCIYPAEPKFPFVLNSPKPQPSILGSTPRYTESHTIPSKSQPTTRIFDLEPHGKCQIATRIVDNDGDSLGRRHSSASASSRLRGCALQKGGDIVAAASGNFTRCWGVV